MRSRERGSMSVFLMVALVGLMLGALLVPLVITLARTTRTATTRVQALDVAQAGIDVTLGKIRAATDAGGLGDAGRLPCTPDGSPITGSVGPAEYAVTVDYFTIDPDKNPGAVEMLCVPGYGTYQPSSGTATASFARLTSVGTVGDAVNGTTRGRTLVTTYVVQTSNTNIAGGTLRVFPAAGSTQAFCIDAGSATPVASTAMVVRSCSTTIPPAERQAFAYRTDLTLLLVSSVSAAYPDGLCLDTAAPPTASNAIILTACPTEGATPTYTQQWSYNDNGHYQASRSTSRTDGTLANLCFDVSAQTAGVPVTLAACQGSIDDPRQAWIPAPSVGAGAAVSPQWVNTSEFGRCLDVTNQDVSRDHLIAYPCKQNPYAGAVAWNQKFTPPTPASGATSATGQFFTTTGGNRYCLQTAASTGGYVVVRQCVANQANQQWTVYGGNSTLSYSTKYTIVDSSSRCLGVTDPVAGETWSAIAIQSCSGATSQKWNADPNLSVSTLQNLREQ